MLLLLLKVCFATVSIKHKLNCENDNRIPRSANVHDWSLYQQINFLPNSTIQPSDFHRILFSSIVST